MLVADQDTPVFAQLDTGSAWSVLARELAEELGLLGAAGIAKKLDTKDGVQNGQLITVPLTIPADEGEGDSLEIPEAKFFVCEDWPIGKSFLGYVGFIEIIRIALDAQENYFYFGPPG
jgi:hypothetical protein